MNSLENREDLRVRRTQKLLWEALVALMNEQKFETITVKDICDRAMVHRTTFYKHYEDKYDLLMKGIWAMHKVLREAYKEQRNNSQPTGAVFIIMCNHIAENEHFYRLMLGKDGIGTFYTLLHSYLTEIACERLDKIQRTGTKLPAPNPVFAQFWAGAVISTIAWWLENDLPYTPEQMASYMNAIMLDSSTFFV
jgi:AcrR family transcriptional regulator